MTSENQNTHNRTQTAEPCPNCGRGEIETRIEAIDFEYGEGTGAVELSVTVPVRYCPHCSFAYEGEAAEQIRHNAVCKYLGYLTPQAVRRVRERHGLNRARFAKLTKIGVATLARWERGALIQNPANDRYLRLLEDPRNIDVLRSLDLDPPTRRPKPEGVVLFPPELVNRHERDAKSFVMHKVG